MPRVDTGPRTTRAPRRTPRSLGTGAALLGCSLLLAVTVPLLDVPAATALVAAVAVAGVLLLARLPHVRTPALALALGGAVPLLAAAPGGDRPAASTVAAGTALAVVAVTGWRLWRRREWAPWYGTRGVVVASATALAVLGFGVVQLADPRSAAGGGADAFAALATVLPWSALIGASGWLRHPVAVALLTPSLVQLVVVAAA